MLKMGWKGHGFGLGKKEQGITEPIEVEIKRRREGLGYLYADNNYAIDLKKIKMSNNADSNNQNQNKEDLNDEIEKLNELTTSKESVDGIVNLLKNFKNSEAVDLVFEKTVSSNGKLILQKYANKLELNVRYEKFGSNRFLVVKKKSVNKC